MSARTPAAGTARILALGGLFALAPCADAQQEPIVGLPCEGCEAVFVGLPATVASASRIAPADEPGQPLRIEGTVRDARGRPTPGITVYAYQTDARGVYPRSDALRGTGAFRHGRLRGWARSDAEGRYAFETIRPSSYPDSDMPAHVHFHVLEPGRCTYYIDDIHFLDDPRLTEAKRRSVDQGRGGSGIAQPTRDSSGRWLVQRDISLGRGVNGYERCG